jgi:hypothetical protein
MSILWAELWLRSYWNYGGQLNRATGHRDCRYVAIKNVLFNSDECCFTNWGEIEKRPSHREGRTFDRFELELSDDA